MIVVVVLAVLDARGSSINLTLPYARPAPEGVDRKLMMVLDGRVRLFDFDAAIDHFRAQGKVTYESLPRVVRRSNDTPFTDGFFDYKFTLKEDSNFYQKYRWVEIRITARKGVEGFSLEDLEGDSSEILEMIDGFGTGDEVWVSFQIDEHEDSISAFRAVREMLAERGIATGWDPTSIEFPNVQTLFKPGGRSSALDPPGPGEIRTN